MIEYTNRRGRKHYLHEGKTKTGKPKYFFSMKSEGTLVNKTPQGYEIYETPNAQVFLRKIPPQIITSAEIKVVHEGVRKYAGIDNAIVDVRDRNIVVHLCDQDVEKLMEIASFAPGRDSASIRAAIAQSLTYGPMMQFVLEDDQTRQFVVQRWCFRGSVDDWISLDRSDDLSQLVKHYGQHLGKDSFFDLIPDYGKLETNP